MYDNDEDLSFEELADANLDDVKEPTKPPAGTWTLQCVSAKINDAPEGKDYRATVSFVHIPVEPGDDIEEEDVEDGTWRGYAIRTVNYLRTRQDLLPVKRFLSAHGINTEGIGLTEALKAMRGTAVSATLVNNTFKRRDGTEGVDLRIKAFASL